ncbi:MAG: hypothetical protein HXX11_12415 [Desulfuromonadales bacterium]|nr:hypothetical protein [Desulfuromonadales bacterium]
MKTAFTHWDNRIAPVFDIAHQIRIVESGDGRIVGESDEILEDGLPVRRVMSLAHLGVTTLVCGAISRPLHEMVVSNGILVVPFVAGDLGEVIRAWLAGTLDNDRFAMPGCCGRHWRRCPERPAAHGLDGLSGGRRYGLHQCGSVSAGNAAGADSPADLRRPCPWQRLRSLAAGQIRATTRRSQKSSNRQSILLCHMFEQLPLANGNAIPL